MSKRERGKQAKGASKRSRPAGRRDKAERAGRRVGRRILLGTLLLALLAFLGLMAVIDLYGQAERAQAAPAIVVLGASVTEQGRASDSLRARTLHAVALYRRHLAGTIICTGGIGKNPPAEGQVAAALARAAGVRPADLIVEDRAENTEENARYTARICRARGWYRVIAVSDPYHLFRVHRDFQREGITAYTSPAKGCWRNRRPLLRFVWTAREALALLRDLAWPWPR